MLVKFHVAYYIIYNVFKITLKYFNGDICLQVKNGDVGTMIKCVGEVTGMILCKEDVKFMMKVSIGYSVSPSSPQVIYSSHCTLVTGTVKSDIFI